MKALYTRLRLLTAVILIAVCCADRSAAQSSCARPGMVGAAYPGCGKALVDLSTGDLLWAVSGLENFKSGDKILFEAEASTKTLGCQLDNNPKVVVTCAMDIPPCDALFAEKSDALNSLTRHFEAIVSNDIEPSQCLWSFGDGSSYTGSAPVHTFPAEGYYNVCLTVSGNPGCSTFQYCKDVYVSAENPTWCDYDLYLTAVGQNLIGKITPASAHSGTLNKVRWYLSKGNFTLSTGDSFTYSLPTLGNYLVCVSYEVVNPADGSVCVGERCQQIVLDTFGCIGSELKPDNAFCPALYAPVCGCDGITYTNECEAMRAGVRTWWAGACNTATQGSCGADVDYQVLDGSPDQGFSVLFTNNSHGSYTFSQLDFGDGSPIFDESPWDTVVHHYAHSGVYRSTLTNWKAGACLSSETKLVITDAWQNSNGVLPHGTDYVLPGDANGDRLANVFDLLYMGLSYLHSGPPRPEAHGAWQPQYAPNWPTHAKGVNDKHADADGNGMINEFDAGFIPMHYEPIHSFEPPTDPGLPKLRISFPIDTIDIDTVNPASLQVEADILLGNSQQPVFDLYGLAFAVHYPEYIKYTPTANYNANSFLGFGNYVNWLPFSDPFKRQTDLGFVRKNGQGANGYGKVAELSLALDFIIIIDVGDRTNSRVVPMTLPIDGILAIDPQGDTIHLAVPVELDTLWLRFETSTSTNDPQAFNPVQVSPNPATDEATIFWGDHNLERVEVFNALGQCFHRVEAPDGRSANMATSAWPAGVYTVVAHSDQGMFERRFVKK